MKNKKKSNALPVKKKPEKKKIDAKKISKGKIEKKKPDIKREEKKWTEIIKAEKKREEKNEAVENKVNKKRIDPVKYLVKEAIFNNPVLVMALGISPVIAVAYSLKNAFSLAVLTMAVILPVFLFTTFFGHHIPVWLRPVEYIALASVLLIPATVLLSKIDSTINESLGVFIPLIAVNTIIFAKSEEILKCKTKIESVLYSFGCLLGFGLIICLVGMIREILGNGSLMELKMPWELRVYGVLMSFGGFIIVGLISAVLSWIKNKYSPDFTKNDKAGEVE